MSVLVIDKKESDKSMSNFETLREAKVAYNYIQDILNNSEIRMDIITAKELENATDILSDLYYGAYLNIKENSNRKMQLETDCQCKNCKNPLLISDNIEYTYQCENCDENFYDFEAIGDNIWYKDEKKEHLKLPSSFNLDIEFDKDEKMIWISSENGSGAKYACENADEFAKAVEFYCNNYLAYDYEKGDELC